MGYPIRRFEFAQVVHVVDGDTVDIEADLGFSVKVKHRFRLAGIDTPERGAPGWTEATEAVRQLVLGKPVIIDVTKLDKYGRYLVELYVDGINVNQELLADRLAAPYM